MSKLGSNKVLISGCFKGWWENLCETCFISFHMYYHEWDHFYLGASDGCGYVCIQAQGLIIFTESCEFWLVWSFDVLPWTQSLSLLARSSWLRLSPLGCALAGSMHGVVIVSFVFGTFLNEGWTTHFLFHDNCQGRWTWDGSWYCYISCTNPSEEYIAWAGDFLLLACATVSCWSENVQWGLIFVCHAILCNSTLSTCFFFKLHFVIFFRLKLVLLQALLAWSHWKEELQMFWPQNCILSIHWVMSSLVILLQFVGRFRSTILLQFSLPAWWFFSLPVFKYDPNSNKKEVGVYAVQDLLVFPKLICFFMFMLSYFSELLTLHRLATLHHDELGQVRLLLMRSFLLLVFYCPRSTLKLKLFKLTMCRLGS